MASGSGRESVGVEQGEAVAIDGGYHLGGVGNDLGGDAGVEVRVMARFTRAEDFCVGDVQDLDGDREAGLEGGEDCELGRDAEVGVGREGNDHRRFAAALAGRGCWLKASRKSFSSRRASSRSAAMESSSSPRFMRTR